ncbi:hypothetical protein I553_8979 [Mycobacterium xenopi 4042]|uniref:Uncharacterized protein n=1 Tax=Mycobacterium xenopi 4042 TaxID=1299334 RepID=X8AMN2_MYCXE|nr:hypothetical protein I552_3861 [Mycobacterium xenopi 3993]EUA32844.1 hypothetical protein I553_8979 [Mycobacterium xenopi 4042]
MARVPKLGRPNSGWDKATRDMFGQPPAHRVGTTAACAANPKQL